MDLICFLYLLSLYLLNLALEVVVFVSVGCVRWRCGRWLNVADARSTNYGVLNLGIAGGLVRGRTIRLRKGFVLVIPQS